MPIKYAQWPSNTCLTTTHDEITTILSILLILKWQTEQTKLLHNQWLQVRAGLLGFYVPFDTQVRWDNLRMMFHFLTIFCYYITLPSFKQNLSEFSRQVQLNNLQHEHQQLEIYPRRHYPVTKSEERAEFNVPLEKITDNFQRWVFAGNQLRR